MCVRVCVEGKRTRGQDAVDELLPRDLAVLVLVDASEEVHDPGLLVVHPAHVLLPPHVKVKVGKLLELKGHADTQRMRRPRAQTHTDSAEEPRGGTEAEQLKGYQLE